jgi:hypothetical protein
MIHEEHKQFLLGPASAGKTRHSGRMLYDHLAGTHALLEAWGNSEDICNAGLFHSIYGTRRFRHQSWPLTDRETIRKFIGAEAEALAYAFCMADRKAFLGNKPILIDQDTWNTLWLSVEILPVLCEIEAANLIEQGSRSIRLKHLCDSNISNNAKHAIVRHVLRLSGVAA